MKSYRKDLRYRIGVLHKRIAGKYLDELAAVAEKLKEDGLSAGITPAGVNRYLAILRRLGNLAFKWGWTDVPYGKRIELLGGERTREVYLTPQQVRAIMKGLDAPHADFVLFASLTGLRRSEILRLTPANVVSGAVILDSRTKSGKPRIVPMPPQALRIAQDRLPWAVTVKSLEKRFDAARIAAGLPHVQFRDLRHTFASWLVKGGESLVAVRDLLGHSSLAVTSRYSHLARPDLARATKKLRV